MVGYTVGAKVQDDAATAWVLRLSVGRHYQGKSIGTALISRLLSKLAIRHVLRAFLSVGPDTIPAKKICDRLGFVKLTHQPGDF